MRWAVLGALAVGLLAGACKEATEGCLDYRAIAIDVEVDKECEGCCVYPRLELQIIPADVQGDSVANVYRAGDLIGAVGDSLRLEQLGFFVSDLELVSASGEAFPLYDTLSVRDSAGILVRREEVSLLRVRPFATVNYAVGSLLPLEEFVGLRLRFGLDAGLAASDSEQPGSASPLGGANDFLLYDTLTTRFRSAAVALQGRSGVDRSIYVPGGEQWPVELAFPQPVQLPKANNLLVRVALSVERLAALTDRDATTAEELAGLLFAGGSTLSAEASRE